MFEKRDIKRDLLALALFALVVFLTISLFSYHRSDPSPGNSSGALVYPGAAKTQNLCGPAGAWAADLLLRLIGVGTYYLIFSLAALDAILLIRCKINQHLVRLIGWLFSLVGFTAIAAMFLGKFFPSLWTGPEVGAGGVIGAVGSNLLLMHFAMAGAYILATSIMLAGLVMCTDYAVFRAGFVSLSGSSRILLSLWGALHGGASAKKERTAVEEEKDKGLSIRILGRPTHTPDVASEQDSEEEEYEEEEYEEEEYEEEEC